VQSLKQVMQYKYLFHKKSISLIKDNQDSTKSFEKLEKNEKKQQRNITFPALSS